MADKEKERAERGVDSVTDYVEAKEVVDSEKAKASLAALSSSAVNEAAAAPSVTIRKEDVEVLVEECELAKADAEALLRKHKGNLQEAILGYVRGN